MSQRAPISRTTSMLAAAAALAAAACATEELPADALLWPLDEPGASDGGDLLVTSWLAPRGDAGLRLLVDGRTVVRRGDHGWEYVVLAGDGGSLGLRLPAGDHTVELIEPDGELRTAAPVRVVPGSAAVLRPPTSLFVWTTAAGGTGSWVFEPVDPDADPTTVEVELGSALDHDALIDRCLENGDDDLCVTLARLPAGGRWRAALPAGREGTGSGTSYLLLRRPAGPPVVIGSLAPASPCAERVGYLVIPGALLAASPSDRDGAAVTPVCR